MDSDKRWLFLWCLEQDLQMIDWGYDKESLENLQVGAGQLIEIRMKWWEEDTGYTAEIKTNWYREISHPYSSWWDFES